LDSYLGTFMTLALLMGLLFELPILVWLLAYLGIVNRQLLRKYRRHAYVAIVTLAAIVTPTTDVFTLALTSLPILLLYELSVFIAGRTEKRRQAEA
ncbi:MAG: twin-arginine translocase subunit TatC, partial [Bacteroidales bacterium]|nr:twin-arginine translocase subunit TatC [Bacteroidales bacterium]